MARPLRISCPGAFYHFTSRDNEQKAVYKSRGDREKFPEYLESATKRYDAVIHAYCLMDNHYHILFETPSGNISKIVEYPEECEWSGYCLFTGKKKAPEWLKMDFCK